MAAAFAIVPASFKPTRFSPNLPRRRRPTLTISATTSDESYFAAANADISSHLLRSLPTTLHPSVKTPIHRLLSSSTPRSIAPSLCLAASELVGGNRNLALNAACAIHLIHAVIHLHTAVSNHQSLTELSLGTELMTGDGLLVLGFEMVARTPADDAEATARLLKVLIEVVMIATAVAIVDEEEREREGKLAACAAACGVLLGGGNEEEVERARRLGMFVGKMELAVAEVELGLGFDEAGAGAVRRLLREMHQTQHCSK